mmetsp:Transcript_135213/g.376720  ORF Transcript_135213/g.376720 Transcript_135213/m.376720 type:complete len:213 (+) Transcript_135213:353-991(+)
MLMALTMRSPPSAMMRHPPITSCKGLPAASLLGSEPSALHRAPAGTNSLPPRTLRRSATARPRVVPATTHGPLRLPAAGAARQWQSTATLAICSDPPVPPVPRSHCPETPQTAMSSTDATMAPSPAVAGAAPPFGVGLGPVPNSGPPGPAKVHSAIHRPRSCNTRAPQTGPSGPPLGWQRTAMSSIAWPSSGRHGGANRRSSSCRVGPSEAK